MQVLSHTAIHAPLTQFVSWFGGVQLSVGAANADGSHTLLH
jgi:hypothetical protein